MSTNADDLPYIDIPPAKPMTGMIPLVGTDPLAGMQADDLAKAHQDPRWIEGQAIKDRLSPGLAEDQAKQIANARKLADRPVNEDEQVPDFAKMAGPEPQFHDFAVQNLPFMLMAMAVGGKVAKTSGQGMLAGMTGMMQGAEAGSLQAFDKAKEQYDQHYQQLRQNWQDKQVIVDRIEKALKGRMDARQTAINIANEAIDGANQLQKNAVGDYNTFEKTMKNLQLQTAKLGLHREQVAAAEDAKYLKLQQNASFKYTTYEAGAKKLEMGVKEVSEIESLLDKVEAKYHNLVLPHGFSDLYKKYGDAANDPDVVRLTNLIKRSQLASLKADLPGSRNNMWFDKAEASQSPELWTEPLGVLRSQAKELKQNLESSIQEKQGAMRLADEAYRNAHGRGSLNDTFEGDSAPKADPLGIR